MTKCKSSKPEQLTQLHQRSNMKSVSKILTLIIVAAIFFACSNKEAEEVDTATLSGTDVENEDMFELIPTGESGLDFANTITEDARINHFNFMHLYMGAGVAVGDVNNDGLQDIYFTGTLVTNKLYLNRGNMVFEDITEKAGVDGGIGFTTGVTMVDINQDGWLDIYVCQSGWFPDTEYLKNKLFINNGDETFTESADS